MTKGVWYRSSAGVSVPPWQDRGTLTVESGAISFAGKKQSVSGRIRSVDRTQLSTTRWVYVQYETEGETRDAYFSDGGLFGWAAWLGGNDRLAEELKASSAQQS